MASRDTTDMLMFEMSVIGDNGACNNPKWPPIHRKCFQLIHSLSSSDAYAMERIEEKEEEKENKISTRMRTENYIIGPPLSIQVANVHMRRVDDSSRQRRDNTR